jgi:hypothetical protein
MRRRHQHDVGLIACLSAALAVLGACCRQPPKKQVSIVDGVEVIVNPAVPLRRDPGRVLRVEERLRIRDVGDRFFFKYPAQPEIAPDGSIFLMEQNQLLRFSPEGAFLGNLVMPGQGPGEIQSLKRYIIEPDGICVADGEVNKVVRMTLDGRYLDDRRLEDHFETMTQSWIIGSLVNLPQVNGVLADAKYSFFCTSRSDESLRKTYAFQGKFYRKPPVMMRWDFLNWVSDAKRDLLFVSLSRDYEIKLLDLNQGRIVRTFRRDYPKVAFVPPENMKAVYEKGGTPRPHHERDVLELFLPGETLWVRTSTVDAEKGQLFDIFNVDGDYLDSFFVQVKGSILGIRGDTIFVKETAADGTIAVVLYRNLEYGKD